VFAAGVALLALVGAACSKSNAAGGPCKPSDSPVITLAAYSNVFDVYGKLTSDFSKAWSADHNGQTPIFQMSFGGSTTQAENIVNGFPADIYASSLDPDVKLVQDAGLITHDWQSDTDHSIVATSVVGFMVRPGNPRTSTTGTTSRSRGCRS